MGARDENRSYNWPNIPMATVTILFLSQPFFGLIEPSRLSSVFVWMILESSFSSQQDANHFLTALHHKYDVTVDWTGKNYPGIDIDWGYKKGHFNISMPE